MVSENGGVDWKSLYRFERAMRFMDNCPTLTKEQAYAMADDDVAGLERAEKELAKPLRRIPKPKASKVKA